MGSQQEGGDAAANAAEQAKKDALFENRPATKKIIRVITVMAYMVSVSFVAVTLSGYYVFFWHPPNPRLLHHSLQGDPQIDYRVDKPPLDLDVSVDSRPRTENKNDRVNVLRERKLRNRGINVSVRGTRQDIEDERPMNLEEDQDFTKRTSGSPRDNEINGTREKLVRGQNHSAFFLRFVDHNSSTFTPSPVDENSSTASTVPLRPYGTSRTANSSRRTDVYRNIKSTSNLGNSTSHTLFTESPSDIITEGSNESRIKTDDDRVYKGARMIDSTSGVVSRPININESLVIAVMKSKGSKVTKSILDDSSEKFENSSIRGRNISPVSPTANLTSDESRSPPNRSKSHAELDDEGKTRIETPPHELGSHISRVLIAQPVINATLQKLELNVPTSTDLADSSTEDVESVHELLPASPLPVQSGPIFTAEEEREEALEQSLTQDTSDFDFV